MSWRSREGPERRFTPVAIVWACELSVEAYAAAGKEVVVPRPRCPACRAWMAFSSGYARYVRAGPVWRIWVRRARCRSCRSHALLPSFCLQGRLDGVEVIGPAVEAAVAGVGARSVARRAGVKHTTARSWCRRHRQRARRALAVVTTVAAALGVGAGAAGGSAERAALSALTDLASVSGHAEEMGLWPAVSVVSDGKWLAAMRPP
jgi:hypothetical protein